MEKESGIDEAQRSLTEPFDCCHASSSIIGLDSPNKDQLSRHTICSLAVGASAGGIPAIRVFLARIPSDLRHNPTGGSLPLRSRTNCTKYKLGPRL